MSTTVLHDAHLCHTRNVRCRVTITSTLDLQIILFPNHANCTLLCVEFRVFYVLISRLIVFPFTYDSLHREIHIM